MKTELIIAVGVSLLCPALLEVSAELPCPEDEVDAAVGAHNITYLANLQGVCGLFEGLLHLSLSMGCPVNHLFPDYDDVAYGPEPTKVSLVCV